MTTWQDKTTSTFARRNRAAIGFAACISMMTLSACASDGGDDGASLEGETVNFVIPFGEGGAFDRIVRVIIPAMEEASGATIVPLNEPGAGGLLATNVTYATPPSQNRLQLVSTPGAVAATLGDVDERTFELEELSWIGAASSEPEIAVVGSNGTIQSFEDLVDRQGDPPLRVGVSGPGDNFMINGVMLDNLFDFEVQLISGFDGAGEIYPALIRGDIDLAMAGLTSVLPPILAGDVRPIGFLGEPPAIEELADMFSDIPSIGDLAREHGDAEDVNSILEPYEQMVTMNRIVAAPPGTSEERLAEYRDVFRDVMSDEDVISSAAESDIYLVYNSGEDVSEMLADVLNADDVFVEVMRQSYGRN